MLTELLGKGGCLCRPAKEGQIRCPLIVRPTSEDVVTGELAQVLRILNPRWWLPDFLNRALGVYAFRRQVFRDFRIDLWQNKPIFPRELLPWDEGSTQVDMIISWENPPTTIYVEAKYGSELSTNTARNNGQYGYASDQLARNIRVGLLECGYFETNRLFGDEQRDFLVLVVSPIDGQPLVKRYQDASTLRREIPNSNLIQRLPRLPFVGELTYRNIIEILRQQKHWFTRPERLLVDQLNEYLAWKNLNAPGKYSSAKSTSLFR